MACKYGYTFHNLNIPIWSNQAEITKAHQDIKKAIRLSSSIESYLSDNRRFRAISLVDYAHDELVKKTSHRPSENTVKETIWDTRASTIVRDKTGSKTIQLNFVDEDCQRFDLRVTMPTEDDSYDPYTGKLVDDNQNIYYSKMIFDTYLGNGKIFNTNLYNLLNTNRGEYNSLNDQFYTEFGHPIGDTEVFVTILLAFSILLLLLRAPFLFILNVVVFLTLLIFQLSAGVLITTWISLIYPIILLCEHFGTITQIVESFQILNTIYEFLRDLRQSRTIEPVQRSESSTMNSTQPVQLPKRSTWPIRPIRRARRFTIRLRSRTASQTPKRKKTEEDVLPPAQMPTSSIDNPTILT